MMRTIERDELELLATGAWILGAGGGGNPYLACLNLRTLYDSGTRVSLMDPMALADDDAVALVSSMGAPLVGRERLSDPRFSAKPLIAMQKYLKCEFRAVMSGEIGGTNALQPLMVAAVTGLPVVDADTMGRAFPESQMTSFAIDELPMLPLVLADIRDTEVIIPRAESAKWMERIARKALTEMGSVAAACKAPRTGREVKNHAILNSTTKPSASAAPCTTRAGVTKIRSPRWSRPRRASCCSIETLDVCSSTIQTLSPPFFCSSADSGSSIVGATFATRVAVTVEPSRKACGGSVSVSLTRRLRVEGSACGAISRSVAWVWIDGSDCKMTSNGVPTARSPVNWSGMSTTASRRSERATVTIGLAGETVWPTSAPVAVTTPSKSENSLA